MEDDNLKEIAAQTWADLRHLAAALWARGEVHLSSAKAWFREKFDAEEPETPETPEQTAEEGQDELLPRVGASGTARLALFLSLCSLAALCYFHVPVVRTTVDGLISRLHRNKTAEKKTARPKKSEPEYEFKIPQARENAIRATMIEWLGRVEPNSGMRQRLDELDTLQEVIGHKVSESEEYQSDYFTMEISAACIAGRKDRPCLVLCVGYPVPTGDGFSFALTRLNGVYEIQELNEDTRDDKYDGPCQGGLADLTVADMDADGATTEVVETWRQGSGGFLHVFVQKLGPDGKWKRVMGFPGAYQGDAMVVARKGRRTPSLLVFLGLSEEHNWDKKPYRIFEYEWTGDRLSQTHEYVTNEKIDPRTFTGPVSPFGLPYSCEVKRKEWAGDSID